MKKILKICTSILLVFTMIFSVFGCGERNSVTPPDDGNTPIVNPTDNSYDRKRQEMPQAKIVDKDYDYGDQSSWAGEKYKSQDLGYVYLQDVIDDNVYDWGHSIIKEDGKYKMWWVRPAVYDAIFYAESVDLKNWTNVQRVICLSPNALTKTNYKNIKGMLGKPSVIHVGDTYYMYFEAPATEDSDLTQSVLEWDNQVMLATSSDGIKWDFYSDSNGEPIPVVAMNPTLMADFNNKNYGIGQPSVFYKDGTFYLTYCYVISDPRYGAHEIRLATSTDGKNFGDTATHKKISDGNGCGVTYNSKTNKYMITRGDYVNENSVLDFTSMNFTRDGAKIYDYDASSIVIGFGEFVKNAHGIVDTETFYIIHLQGKKSLTDDWRSEHQTWDGYIHAVNPKEYANRTFTLPNGAAATENNLKEYRDRANTYSKVSADAVYVESGKISIDGEKDDIYSTVKAIEISRPVYGYGSNFTNTWGKAWIAWNEDFLYVYVEVYDSFIDTSYRIATTSSCYMRDSLDVFIDTPNDHGNGKDVALGLEQYMICTGANNEDFIIKGSDEYDLTSEFTTKKHRVKRTDYGYNVELQIEWFDLAKEYIQEGSTIGVDFQINDNMGGKVGREAMVAWSDHTGNAFQFIENYGDVYLIKK